VLELQLQRTIFLSVRLTYYGTIVILLTFVSVYFLFSALDPGYVISFNGDRNFLLCKKQIEALEEKLE
jgi:hypothetical protein